MAQAEISLFSTENFNSGATQIDSPDPGFECDYSRKHDSHLNKKDSTKIPLNDNSDSGYSTNSDSDSSNSSGSPKEDIIDRFITTALNNVKEASSFRTTTGISYTDNPDLEVDSGLFSSDSSDFSNVLSEDIRCSKNNIVSQSQINGEKDLDHEEELSFSKFINDIDLKVKYNMVVPCKSHTDRLKTGHKSGLNFNKCVYIAEDSNVGCDLTDLLSSVSIHNSNSSSSSFTESSPSINADDCLSDLLSSISYEDNIRSNGTEFSEKFAFTLLSDNVYSSDSKSCDDDDVSLAALAVQHLSSSGANSYSENNEKKLKINCYEADDVIDILNVIDSEKIYFTSSSSETSTSSSSCEFQNSFVMENCDEDIDLTFCLKTDKTPDLTVKIETLLENSTICTENVDFQDITYHITSSPSIPNCIEVDKVPTIKKINKRESLFSKALSCKPKTKQVAYLKVLSLKNDICDQFFNLPNSVEPKKYSKEFVQLSNESAVVSLGRRTFA